MEQFFASLAAPMVGFVLLYFVLQKNFESQSKLVEKIDKLADNIHELVINNVQKNANLANTAEEIKEMYIKISSKQEAIKKTVEETNIRTQLCPKFSEVKA